MSRARVSIDGPAKSAPAAASSGSDPKQKIKLAIAGAGLLAAAALIAWQMGMFEPSRDSQQTAAPAPVAEAQPEAQPQTNENGEARPGYEEAAKPTRPVRRGGGLVAPGFDPNKEPEAPPPSEEAPK